MPPFLPSALVALLTLSPLAYAHIQLASPYPINSALNPNTPEAEKDYSMTSPIVTDGSYPCKGFIGQGYDQGTIPTFSAGNTIPVKLSGTAVHGGGSCQLSLSYDNGTNFRVIESRIGGCPSDSLTFDVDIPSAVPAGKNILFSWSWSNKYGNREFYQNCAIINIDSDSTTPLTGPTIFVSNAEVNTCTTIEGTPIVYPYPGDVVTYGGEYAGKSIGNGLTSGSGISGSDCFAPNSDGAGSSGTGGSVTTSKSTTSSAVRSSAPASLKASSAVAKSSAFSSIAPTSRAVQAISKVSASSTSVGASKTPALSLIVQSSTLVGQASSVVHRTSSLASIASSSVAKVHSSVYHASSAPMMSFVASSHSSSSSSSPAPTTSVPTSAFAPSPTSSDVTTSVHGTDVSSSSLGDAVAQKTATAGSRTVTSAYPSVTVLPTEVSSAKPAVASADTATCVTGSWACNGSVLQECVYGSLLVITDCALQAGTVCNASDPVGCVWPWQVIQKRAVPRGHADARRAVHGKKRFLAVH